MSLWRVGNLGQTTLDFVHKLMRFIRLIGLVLRKFMHQNAGELGNKLGMLEFY